MSVSGQLCLWRTWISWAFLNRDNAESACALLSYVPKHILDSGSSFLSGQSTKQEGKTTDEKKTCVSHTSCLKVFKTLVGRMVSRHLYYCRDPGTHVIHKGKIMTHLFAATLAETTTASLAADHQRGLSVEFNTWLHIHKQCGYTGVSCKQRTDMCSHLRRSEQVAAWITRNAALDKGQCREGRHKYTKGYVQELFVAKQHHALKKKKLTIFTPWINTLHNVLDLIKLRPNWMIFFYEVGSLPRPYKQKQKKSSAILFTCCCIINYSKCECQQLTMTSATWINQPLCVWCEGVYVPAKQGELEKRPLIQCNLGFSKSWVIYNKKNRQNLKWKTVACRAKPWVFLSMQSSWCSK